MKYIFKIAFLFPCGTYYFIIKPAAIIMKKNIIQSTIDTENPVFFLFGSIGISGFKSLNIPNTSTGKRTAAVISTICAAKSPIASCSEIIAARLFEKCIKTHAHIEPVIIFTAAISTPSMNITTKDVMLKCSIEKVNADTITATAVPYGFKSLIMTPRHKNSSITAGTRHIEKI